MTQQPLYLSFLPAAPAEAQPSFTPQFTPPSYVWSLNTKTRLNSQPKNVVVFCCYCCRFVVVNVNSSNSRDVFVILLMLFNINNIVVVDKNWSKQGW